MSESKKESLKKITEEVAGLRVCLSEFQKNAEKYRLLFENMKEGFSLHEIIQDENGKVVDFRFLDTNNAYERFVGLKREDMLGKTMLEILPQADLRQIEAYGRVALTGEPLQFEYFSKTYGKHLRVNAFSPQRGFFATIYEDITERKQNEDILRRMEEKYHGIWENAVMGIFQSTLEGRFLSVNPTMAHIYGYESPEEMISLVDDKIEQKVHADPQTRAEFVRLMVKNGMVADFEAKNLRKDGSPIYTRTNARTVRDANGNLLYFEGFLEDITQSKQAEERLRFQAQILDNAGEAVLAITTDGCFIYWNKLAEELLGYRNEDVIGKKIESLMKKTANVDQVVQARKQLLQGKVWKGEMAVLGRENRLVDIQITATPVLDDLAKITSVIAVLHDVTEDKKIWANLIEAKKMAGIGTLAAGIAHELNTPLQIITGYSETAAERIRQNKIDSERLLHNLVMVNQSAWRCRDIVLSLLTYAHPGTEEKHPEDLNQLVKDTLLLIEHQMHSWSGITTTCNLAENLPALRCNRNQISQVLINLLTNAGKAMRKGGTIAICSGYDADIKHLWLQVADSGPGIPAAIREHVFEPFFTTNPVGEGTGLGLSIVQSIMRSHMGYISVGDADPHGAILTLYFPEFSPGRPAGQTNDEKPIGRYDKK